MKALRYLRDGTVKLIETATPVPRAGQVRLAVKGAGICHSDVRIAEGTSVAKVSDSAPFTLGHEIAGVVDELGEGIDPSWLGTEVAVYGPSGCLQCPSCKAGAWNYCDWRDGSMAAGIGLGEDGGLAEFVTVDVRRLVPTAGLDSGLAAVLTDAALTSHHAVSLITWRSASPRLVVVIGVGGLGHLAVQLLSQQTDNVTIVAVDTRPTVEDLAVRSGADVFCTPEQLADIVTQRSDGRGASAVLDFVGAEPTMRLGESVLGTLGDFVLVGSSGGALSIDKKRSGPRRGLSYRVPVWGTLPELEAVIALGREGRLKPELTRIKLVDAEQGLRDLAAGRVSGRLVVTDF